MQWPLSHSPPLSVLTGHRLRHCVMLYARYPTRRRKAGVIFRQGQRYSLMGYMLGYNQVCEDKLVWRLPGVLPEYQVTIWLTCTAELRRVGPRKVCTGTPQRAACTYGLEVSVSSPNRPLLAPDWRACYLVIPTLSHPRVSRKNT